MTKGRDIGNGMKPFVLSYLLAGMMAVGLLIGLGINVLLGIEGGARAVVVAVIPGLVLLIPTAIWWMRK